MQKNLQTLLIGCLTLWAICVYSTQSINAQTVQCEQTYGGSSFEYMRDLISTNDGGYLMGGSATSSDGDIGGDNNGYEDFWVVKTDANGTIEWEQNYGGPERDFITAVIQTADGGYLLAGTVAEYVFVDECCDPLPPEVNYLVIKIDANGNVEWQQIYDYDPNFEYGSNRLSEVLQTVDGGYLLVGSNEGGSGWVIKINATGIIEWEQSYLAAGSFLSNFSTVVMSNDGGYLLGGGFRNNSSDSDYWVVKIDANGNIEWEQNYGGSSREILYSIINTNDGGYLLGGTSTSSDGDVGGNNGNEDLWVVKIDVNGNIEWEQNYGGSYRDDWFELTQTNDGNYAFVGRFNTDPFGAKYTWVVKIDDANGEIIWEEYIERTFLTVAQDVVATENGITLGGWQSLPNEVPPVGSPNNDFWLLKMIDLSVCEGDGFLPILELEREGALYGPTSFPLTGDEVYTWYSLPDSSQVAQFTGHPYYSPSSLGTYYLIVTDPDYPDCTQLIGPRTIDSLNGCCELDEEGN